MAATRTADAGIRALAVRPPPFRLSFSRIVFLAIAVVKLELVLAGVMFNAVPIILLVISPAVLHPRRGKQRDQGITEEESG